MTSTPAKLDALLWQATKLHPQEIDLGLGRMHTLLKKLGDPHKKLPPVIHVAGTNGKGSTLAFLSNLLARHGYSFHRYTSPHLMHFHERMFINCAPWTLSEKFDAPSREQANEIIVSTIEWVLSVNNGAPITQFELITCAAFVLFAQHPADYTLLEVGLGGRLDATNVIKKPVLTLITSIGLDHTFELGETLEAIAAEKAGIIKPNVPILYPQSLPYEAKEVISSIAKVNKALICETIPYSDKDTPHGFLGLKGEHQLDNAGLALTALKFLGIPVLPSLDIKDILQKTEWKGRFQTIHIPSKGDSEIKELIIDGAHNSDGIRALVATLQKTLHTKDPEGLSITFFIHIKYRKNFIEMLMLLSPVAKCFYIVDFEIDGGIGTHYASIQAIKKYINVPFFPLQSVEEMFHMIANEEGPFVATGSLFWIGELLAYYEENIELSALPKTKND